MHFPNILDTVGNTPLVKLQHLSPRADITILAKCEFLNPSGSVKDRIVKYIIEDAEKNGLLKPGGVIVESTSGNTGAATAMIAAMKGYRAILTMPDKVSQEKQDALKAYGAEIIITPTSAAPGTPEHYLQRAIRIEKETPNSFRINQYDNLKNPEAHYKSTGPEIWREAGGHIDYFVAAASTGGTISGVSRYLKEHDPNIHVVMPDPIGSIYYDYFKTKKVPAHGSCSYFVEGIGEDHLVKAIDFSLIDEVIQFNDKQAFAHARRLAREEGILAGGSSGANIWGSLQVANRLDRPAVIVTILPDLGIKYLSKCFNEAWLKQQNLLD